MVDNRCFIELNWVFHEFSSLLNWWFLCTQSNIKTDGQNVEKTDKRGFIHPWLNFIRAEVIHFLHVYFHRKTFNSYFHMFAQLECFRTIIIAAVLCLLNTFFCWLIYYYGCLYNHYHQRMNKKLAQLQPKKNARRRE